MLTYRETEESYIMETVPLNEFMRRPVLTPDQIIEAATQTARTFLRSKSRRHASDWGDTVEDIAQDIYLKLLQSGAQPRHPAYVNSCTWNHLIDKLRKKRPVLVHEDSAPEPEYVPTLDIRDILDAGILTDDEETLYILKDLDTPIDVLETVFSCKRQALRARFKKIHSKMKDYLEL